MAVIEHRPKNLPVLKKTEISCVSCAAPVRIFSANARWRGLRLACIDCLPPRHGQTGETEEELAAILKRQG